MNLTFWLLSGAIVLQSVESLTITPWPWKILRNEMPVLLRPFLKSEPLLHALRLAAVVVSALTHEPLAIAAVLLATWLINVRWRGTFNGGSDAMTVQALVVWLLLGLYPEQEFALCGYLSFLLILSYFVAGVAKVMNPAWRDGSMMAIVAGQYGLVRHPGKVGAWVLMIFELLFPLALVLPLPFLVAASVFHFAAVYTLGLNRFFFVWIALFPALIRFHQFLVQ